MNYTIEKKSGWLNTLHAFCLVKADHNSNGDFIDRELSYDERIQYALQQRRRRAHGRARGKQKPGPKPTTVRLKFYLLPSGCDLPKFSRQDPIIDTHMSQGYGKQNSKV